MKREDVVQAARGWLGTPYVHQMAVKGAGCDCLGLVRGVWREVLGEEPALPPAYTMDWSEASGDERLWQAAEAHLTSKSRDRFESGDVVLFRMRQRSVAKHLGIIGRDDHSPSFMHAYNRYGVVESPLTRPWARRIVAAFEFPEGLS